jgi:Fe-S-cluster-containing dehydrogenase component
MHDTELCIGCRKCQRVCPYSNRALGPESLAGETYSVISYNAEDEPTQPFWTDTAVAIPGVTSSGADVAKKAGAATPMLNAFAEGNVKAVRTADKVEKCTFCYHRTSQGLQPACVEVCPSRARIFGDQEDPKSEIAQVLKKEKSFRLKEEAGTRPNVHYVGKYSARG